MRQRHFCWPALGQGAAAILMGIALLVSPPGRIVAQDAVAAPAAAAQPATAPAAAQPMPGQPMPPGGKPMVGPDGKPIQPMVGPDGKPIQPMPGETKPA